MWPIIKKAVNSDLSTPLNVLIDSVKTIVNSSKTVIDTIKVNVGSNADASSAAGSVHAKVKELRSFISGELVKTQRPRGMKRIEWNIDPETLTDVLNIRGKGEFLALGHLNYNATGDGGQYKIIVDGVEIFHGNTGSVGTQLGTSSYYASAFNPGLQVASHTALPKPTTQARFIDIAVSPSSFCIPFKTSLIIQCARVGTNNVYGVALYSLE
jgi:hypothetical protein